MTAHAMNEHKKPLQALIVSENDARAKIIEQGLIDGRGAVVDRILLTADLQSRVDAIEPDAVLIDLGDSAVDRLEQVFELVRWANRPVVVFVDQTDPETAQAAADAGVSAYVVDGLRRERIKAVLDVAISRFRVFAKMSTELNAAKVALDERKLIDQAKSFLMRQKGLAEHEAYALLRRTAMNQSRKIADIARSLLAAAELVSSDPR